MVASRLPSKRYTIPAENQTIIHDDCLQVMKKIPNESVDIFITSPPYNIGIKYGMYQDNKPHNQYLADLHQLFSEVKRVLKNDGSIFLNIGCTNRNPWLAFDVAYCLRDLFVLQNRIIWVKSISINDATYGHFKPINSGRFINYTHEDIFHFTKDGDVKLNRTAIGVPYMDKKNIRRKADSLDLRCRGNCWYIPYKTIRSVKHKGGHPAIYPEKLVEYCIKLAGYDSETLVCDPFLGTGTTLVVTERLGINGIGIEIDENYFEYARQRIGAV